MIVWLECEIFQMMLNVTVQLAQKRAAKYSVTDEAAVRNISACHAFVSRAIFGSFPPLD
jgi:hypothetical protein